MTKTFSHSGARGDIIYGLPAVRCLGGGILYIKNDIWHLTHGSRPLADKDIELFKELLCDQHYIKDVRKWEEGIKIDYNLDKFREVYSDFISIAKLQLMAFNVYTDLREPWIDSSVIKPKHIADIVVNRSERYHGPFDWGELSEWQDKCTFVGLVKEYDEFKRITGLDKIKYHGECSYREILEIILGSKLFIGNQSFAFALAEAVKHPRVLEVLPQAPNCLLQGPRFHSFLTQNVLRHYLLGESLQAEKSLTYYQQNSPSYPRKYKNIPGVSYILTMLGNKSPLDFIAKATADEAEVIIPVTRPGKSFEELANEGAEDAVGDIVCIVDMRSDVEYLSAFKLTSQLGGKEGLIGTYLNLGYGRPYMAGECTAVSRRAYEECGLFNPSMLPGELNYLEMNLRYSKKWYACRSGGQLRQSAIPDENFDRNAKYIQKMYGVKV